jgi:NADH-quinone oxidoreductase subunit N
MLLAFSVPGDEGVAAIAFYLVPYCAMNLGAFLVVLAVSEAAATAGGAPAETIDSVRGLGTRAPGMAAALAVFLFSLVGLPPFAGFVGKLYVFVALLRGGGDYRSWYFFLAAAGVVNTVVSFFYYSRVLRAMYLTAAPPGEDGPVSVRRLHAVMTAMVVAPTVVLGVWWGPLYAFVTRTMTLIR